jgi:hypothetical protein
VRQASIRSFSLLTAAALVVPGAAVLLAASPGVAATPEMSDARKAAPVILTGAQLADWSQLPATGLARTYPSGAQTSGDSLRSAHNGTMIVPPTDGRTGIDPDTLAAYSWTDAGWKEVPVQVDQKFPYFLANGHSGFSTYSGTDEELTYAWAPDRHETGEEAWKKVFGDCSARYATAAENDALPTTPQPFPPTKQVNATKEPADSGDTVGYTGAMSDPVPQLDDDDEVSFMARDAGGTAPTGAAPPAGTLPAPSAASPAAQSVQVVDPLDPTTMRYVYLFRKTTGSSFNSTNGYVQMSRDPYADSWIDRDSFVNGSPEQLGSSNTSYGPNLAGQVCTNFGTGNKPAPRASTDRFPEDATTITTPTYQVHTSGRWMVRSMAITRPGTTGTYGPDLISRWKGRAFQQSPDSSVSVVGFEDEQVNWEANSALLGWRAGPVRAIREIWGADSGTNVTKVETYYRDADTYAYHVRVHPIPPDGLYTSWDYNPGAVSTYFNTLRPNGVPIDGVNDDTGQIDKLPGGPQCPYQGTSTPSLPIPFAGGSKTPPCPGDPAYVDVPDPTFDLPSAIDRPEEVAGPNGGFVYEFEFTGPTSGANPAAVPYYRDDACLDDGTGDAPLPRPWPGEDSSDPRVQAGYLAYWQKYAVDHPEYGPGPTSYTDLTCNPTAPATTPPWQRMPFAAAFGQHGIHFFVTQDSDNAFLPKPVDEVVGQQWRFSVPMDAPNNVSQAYGENVSVKLTGFAAPYAPGAGTSAAPSASPSASGTASPSASSSASASASPSPSATAGTPSSASATPTATISPSATAAGRTPLTISVSPDEITPGPAATVSVHGSPNSRVQLMAYSRPSTTYRVARDDVTNGNGDITFRVTPGTNTRLYATYGDGNKATDSGSEVISVHTTLSVSGIRKGVRVYDFHGRDLPRRSGQLITLYRVDASGDEIRTAAVHTDSTGTWQLDRTFAGAGMFRFLVRTSANLTNADGRSNVISVNVH